MTESQSERLLRALEDLVDEVRATKHEICVLRVDLINRWQDDLTIDSVHARATRDAMSERVLRSIPEARPDGPTTRGSR